MRPNQIECGAEVHECLECGNRTEADDAGICPECGGELLHLGRSRDL
ncbi:rubrerythrin-like domain-containing protein [Natronomonas sp.]|nr:rubrerythrin-like domain-containing protein [Natronomonas sp.]